MPVNRSIATRGHDPAHPRPRARVVVDVEELRAAGVADGARGFDERLGVRAERRVDLDGDDELALAQRARELRLLLRARRLRRRLALAHEERAGRAPLLVDGRADRLDLRRRRAAAAADDARAELARPRRELAEVRGRRVREDDALAGHAREADVRERGERVAAALHVRERRERGGGSGAVVRAERGEAERAQARRRVLGRDSGEGHAVGVERQQRDDRQRGDGAHRRDRRLELVEVEERLDHEEVDAAAFEHRRLLRDELGGIEAAQLDVAERPDRAGDEDVAPRDLARLARDAHGGGVDRLRLLREEVARELAAVRAERVRLDELGAGVDVAEVHAEHALGRAEVRLLGAAQSR